MTQSMLENQLVKLDRNDVPVGIFYMKQPYLAELRADLSKRTIRA